MLILLRMRSEKSGGGAPMVEATRRRMVKRGDILETVRTDLGEGVDIGWTRCEALT